MDEGHRHYHLGIEKLVHPDFRKASDFFKLSNLPLLHQVKPLEKHYANMSNYFDDPRLKAAFTFQDVYMGLSPFEAPATFSMMPYTELAHGVWYPKGGMYQVVEALMSLAREAGVEFIFNATVEQIEVNGRSARGVIADGQRSGGGCSPGKRRPALRLPEPAPTGWAGQKAGAQALFLLGHQFLLGNGQALRDATPAHALPGRRLPREFRQHHPGPGPASQSQSLYPRPGPARPIHGPSGQDTLIAIVPVGHMSANGEQDWGAIRDQARGHVFRRLRTLGIHDLEEHIKFEVNFTPLSWRKRYNLVKGSTHGLCHNLTQLGYFRPDNQHPRYRNLYFTGASTRPGTGLPTAMVSGRQSAQRIMDEL